MKRVILVVIDSLGIGCMNDVINNRREDIGANTLKNVLEHTKELSVDNLEKLGLFNALGEEVKGYKFNENAVLGRANLGYNGADSFLGHLRMFGYNTNEIKQVPFQFNIKSIKTALKKNGLKVIEKGNNLKYLVVEESVFIGDNIEAEPGSVYSVIGDLKKIKFDKINLIANIVRENVDIARVVSVGANININEIESTLQIKQEKYIGLNSEKCNLYNRGYKVQHLSYSIKDSDSVIRKLKDKNNNIYLFGKIADMISEEVTSKYNYLKSKEIFKELKKHIKCVEEGLIAVNFQECDLSGHLQDVNMYSNYLSEIDSYLGWILNNLKQEDLLIVTADHGNDPTIGHRYHTREKVPILIYKKGMKGKFLGEFNSLSIIGNMILDSMKTS